MQRLRARVAWTATAFALAVSAVVLAADAPTFAGEPPSAPAATGAVSAPCSSVGPYAAPEPGSVGVPAVLVLCATGPVTITAAGALLDGWDVRGGIVVDAPDVTVRRSRVTGDGTSADGIRTTARGSVRIEDTTFTGDFSEAALAGDRWSGERLAISGVTHDGARLGAGSRLRNSSVQDVATAAGDEARAVVLRGSPVLLEDNRIDAGGERGGSAVLLAPDAADGQPDGDVVIRGNVLGGGRWVLRQDAADGGQVDVLITGNRFRRGVGQEPLRVSQRAVLSDNSYLDGGSLPAR